VTKGIALLLSAFAGMLVAMQPPINSKLGGAVGTFAAATISFMVGTAALFVVAAASGGTHLEGLRACRGGTSSAPCSWRRHSSRCARWARVDWWPRRSRVNWWARS
jgi:hypothetical protein